jgi:sugar lactone lactonase YvrE
LSPEPIACEPLTAVRHELGESPVWCERTQCLWWIDVRAPSLQRWNSRTGQVERWPMPQLIGAVVLTEGHSVVVALQQALHRFDAGRQQLEALVALEAGMPEQRLNEAGCDNRGRLWCGSMRDFGLSTAGSLYRLDAGLAVLRQREQITIPNSIGFSPDGRRMYFADSGPGRIDCADYDADTGLPGAWRPFVPADAAPGKPDGCTIDSEGCLWSARYGGGCIARFTPEGRLDRLLALPVSQPTSCAFGGPDLGTLFVTTAAQRLSAAELTAQPLAGAVLALQPGAYGRPVNRFAGTP